MTTSKDSEVRLTLTIALNDVSRAHATLACQRHGDDAVSTGPEAAHSAPFLTFAGIHCIYGKKEVLVPTVLEAPA